jgi:(1->4)-alpha-D-glucan 1-alpha-D-glucosylmutase
MLTTSTHDTKRSEDVRARLNVLSEIPQRWTDAVKRWAQRNTLHKRNDFPDRNAEYLLYQTLVGAWPIEVDRTLGYMEKAAREAKVYTSWTNPVDDYEEAVADFVRAIYADEHFTADLTAFVDEIKEAGWINGLAQKLITLTAPGIPDIYQGTELWDLSLVDPDNRRPVDYVQRTELLATLDGMAPEAIWEGVADGLPKLWVVRQALALRRERPQIFGAQSSYQPIPIHGTENAVAYTRGQEVVVLVPRFTLRHGRSWPGATITIPGGRWQNWLSGEMFNGGSVPIDDLLAPFPACLLVKID